MTGLVAMILAVSMGNLLINGFIYLLLIDIYREM